MAGDYGLWQGAERATGTALATGMNLLQYQGQQDYRTAQLQLERDKLQMLDQQRKEHAAVYEQQARQIELHNQQTAKNQELIPADETLNQLGMTRPEQQQQFKARYAPLFEKGQSTGTDMIQRQHAEKIAMDYLKDTTSQLQDVTLKGQLAKRDYDSLVAQLADPEVMKKMKPEQLTQIQQQKTTLINEMTAADNNAKYLHEKLKEPTQNILTPQGWKGVSTRVEGPLGGIPEKVVTAEAGNQTKSDIADLRNQLGWAKLAAGQGKQEEKTDNQLLKEDYAHIQKAYADIIKGESPDSSWTPTEFKSVQGAARRGLSYLPGIRGNRAKLDEAMSWLANPWGTGQPQTNTPEVGTVIKGYKFSGGDPASQKSWQKVK